MQDKPIVIVIDDDKFHLGNIEFELKEHATVYGYHPRDLDDIEEFGPIRSAKYALIDWDFKTHTSLDNKVVEYLRDNGFVGKALLCSLHEVVSDKDEIRKKFDGVLQKKDLAWEHIAKY